MIYVTGDTHGDYKRIQQFCEKCQTSPDDTLIILGDAGFNYFRDWRDQHGKKKISRLPITVFSIHGNHEQRPETISSYHLAEWHGGQVYMEDEYPNLLFAMDGELYDLDGKSTIVIGGAYSVDKYRRLTFGLSWWSDEQPSEKTKQKVESVLKEHNWTVDTVLSHTAPLKYEPVEAFLPMVDQSTVDRSTEIWLDSIENRLSYRQWYLGHYHIDKKIDKMRLLFETIEELR